MPRKLRARPGNKPVRKKPNSEPLAEGIIVPLDKRGRRSWESMNNEKIVEYAKNFIREKKIKNRNRLAKEDAGLCDILRRRNLLDRLEFEGDERAWSKYSDDKLVDYAERFIESNGIKNRTGLYGKDGSLYVALRKRELLERIKFEVKKKERRDWASLSDGGLVEYAKEFIKEKGIKNRRGLQKKGRGLYKALWKRGLLDKLEFEKGLRNWASMSDDELVAYARKYIKENGITKKSDMRKKDNGLYIALCNRKLLDKLKFEKEKRKERNWASMRDDELVEHAKNFIKKIKNRHGLEKEDKGLYEVLRRRKLLDLVFSDMEKAKEKQAVQDVFDALMEFGGPG